MMRKLAVALSLAGVLTASVVQALGLGEASVQSTLNQPLNAEIELVNVRDLANNEILPGMASREDFLKAGVERIYFLSDVRFEVQRNAAGKVVVQLTTSKPVREPFLNFLVEVIWPSGRLLREYALLIDPPIYGEEPLAPVRQVVSTPERVETPPKAAPGARIPDRTAAVAKVPSAERDAASGANTYGPTSGSDTLWAIALKVRPDSSVTPQQTMLALQDLNPDSFIGNNINSLKKGQILRLPTLNDIRGRSKREAVRAVIAQNTAFENRALGKTVVEATSPEKAPIVEGQKATGDELKLVVADSRSSEPKAGAHAGDSVTEGESSALKDDLAITLEKLDQSALENRELGSQVKDLEEQLATLQRLLTLKDDQLAMLQTQMVQEKPDQVVVPVEGVDKALPERVAVEQGDAPAETKPETPPAPKVAVPAAPATATDTEKQDEALVPSKWSLQSIIEMILNNPLYQLIAGGIVILLLAVVWVLSRRNAQREQAFFETIDEQREEQASGDIFDTEETIDIGGDDEAEVSGVAEDVTAPLQSETEDVMAEADIYIAYDRLDQAAQLLENAISSEPQRSDIRIKLLEVYAESGEMEAFEKQFSEIEALNDDYAMEQASRIRGTLVEPAQAADFEQVVSIDELESQLLSGDDTTSGNLVPVEFEATEEAQEKEEPSEERSQIETAVEALESELEIDSVVEEDLLAAEDNLDIEFDIDEIDLEVDEISMEEEGETLDLDLEETLDIGAGESQDAELEESLEAAYHETEIEEPEYDVEVEEGLALDRLEPDSEALDLSLEEELEQFDGKLEEAGLAFDESAALDLSGETEALEAEQDHVELEETGTAAGIDTAETEALDISAEELSLDDLDLELDKIDSELGVSFDLESEVETVEEPETVLPDSAAVVDQLEEIAETLTEEPVEESQTAETELGEVDVEVAEGGEAVDDSLLEEAEEAVAEIDEFEADLAEDDDFDFLAGTDEAATKLDLARAYIDMGDSDGAKDILEEVALEGSNEQKQEAQELLKTLD